MPAGSYSAWDIGTRQRFMHIYFSNDYIKQLALRHLDIDPRRVQLPQLTFENNQSLDALVTHGVANRAWGDPDNRMVLQHNLNGVLINLLQAVGIAGKGQSQLYKGGLSPIAKRRVKDYIDAHYARRIDLSELASEAGLSEFHFARMFKLSFACTPQQYINDLRIRYIKAYLTQSKSPHKQSLAALALAHGFSSQSHMGRVFKQVTGTTPAKFSRAAH